MKKLTGVLVCGLFLSASVFLNGCLKSEIVGQRNDTEPEFETRDNIVLDWNQIRADAEEQFNDTSLYPLSDYIDLAFDEGKGQVLLIWSISNDATLEDALEYGASYVKGINDIATDQDFSLAKSSDTSYGGLFDKYNLQLQVFREADIMEESNYYINMFIPAGSNAAIEAQQKN